MSVFVKEAKVGDGTYGFVYKARRVRPPPISTGEAKGVAPPAEAETEVVAVKRNLKDTTTSWIGNVRELNMLARLKGNPFIIDLREVILNKPFGQAPITPIDEKKLKCKEDNVHFVLEYVPVCLERFVLDKRKCTPHIAKILTCQLLLGMEFVHNYGITHRDMKPANLLISNSDDPQTIQLKIIDFGLSQTLCPGIPATPGVATSWYRAPEICCRSPTYTEQSDMWSVGCVIFELFGRHPWLQNTKDTDDATLTAILKKMPYKVSTATTDKLRVRNVPRGPVRRKTFIDQMKMDATFATEFRRTVGTTAQLQEVLLGLLNPDPDARWTATQTLAHGFFADLKAYIDEVRQKYPPVPPPLPYVVICDSLERKWALNHAFELYNTRETISWYKHRIIFHAIDLFDRYLEWAYKQETTVLRPFETQDAGRLHTKAEVELRFCVCLYVMHKFFCVLSFPEEWRGFAPAAFHSVSSESLAEQFETLLVIQVAEFQIYRDTLLEIATHYNHKLDVVFIARLLHQYGLTAPWDAGSMRALYRKIAGELGLTCAS